MKWSDWNPGAISDEKSYEEVLGTMPAAPIGGIPRLVRLLENPRSPYHLAGPAALKAHDIIHVTFGRGLLQQDEAFVIGATMGNASAATNLDRLWFLDFAANAYPKPFTFSERDANVFNIAFDFGMSMKKRDIHLLKVSDCLDLSVRKGRKKFGVSIEDLCRIFELEVGRWPETKVSKRLRATYL